MAKAKPLYEQTIRVPFEASSLTGLIVAANHIRWFEQQIGTTVGGLLTLDETGTYEQPHVPPPDATVDWAGPEHAQSIEIPADAKLVVGPLRIEAAGHGDGHLDLVVYLELTT